METFFGKDQQYKLVSELGLKGKSHAYLVECGQNQNQFVLKKYLEAELRESQKEFLIDRLQNQPKDSVLLQINKFTEETMDKYLITEYCNGSNIKQMITLRQINLKQLKSIILHTIKSLKIIHSLGYIYNALTPTSIVQKILKKENESEQYIYKLCNFNSLIRKNNKFYSQDIKALENKIRQDRYAYKAPEVLEQGEIDFSSDIWSLGVVIFELYANEKLFLGNMNEIIRKMRQYCKDQSDIQQKLNQYIKDEKLREFLRSMLNPEMKKRPTLGEVEQFFRVYYVQQTYNELRQTQSLPISCATLFLPNDQNLQLGIKQEYFQALLNTNNNSTVGCIENVQQPHRSTIFLTKASVLNIIQEIESKHQINAEEFRQKISQFLEQDKACELSKTFEEIEKKINGIRQETGQILQQTNQLSNNQEIEIYDTQTQEVQQICKALLELKKKILSFGKK